MKSLHFFCNKTITCLTFLASGLVTLTIFARWCHWEWPFTFTAYLLLAVGSFCTKMPVRVLQLALLYTATLSSVTQLSPQPCIPHSLLAMLAALHALFTATLKYRAESESCMLRQLNRGGAVTTAESVCHRVITFFFSHSSPAVQLPKWEGLS